MAKINGVEYAGQTEKALTYTIAAGAVVSDAVALTAAGTAGRGAAEAVLLGKLVTLEADGKGAVAKRGIIIVRYTGVLTFGFVELVVDGAGAVKAAAVAGALPRREVIGTFTENAVNYAIIDLN